MLSHWSSTVPQDTFSHGADPSRLSFEQVSISWKVTLYQRKIDGTATWENIPSGINDQWRLISACASTQSDQSLRCSYEETSHHWLSKMYPLKILISLRECAGWSESSLGAHTWRYVFWHYGSNGLQYGLADIDALQTDIAVWNGSY